MLLWLVGARASGRLGLRESTQITLGGAAATRLLPTAGVGGAAVTLWALRRSGLGGRGAARTLLTFLVLLYSVFLGSIAVTGTLLTIQGGHSLALTALPAALARSAWCSRSSPRLAAARRTAAASSAAAAVLGGAVRDAIGHLRSLDPRLLGALVWWGFDMAVLYGMLNAFGTAPASRSSSSRTSSGRSATRSRSPARSAAAWSARCWRSASTADLAIVSVLAYRAIAIWLPAPIGLVALGALRRTIAAMGPRGRRGRGRGRRGRAAAGRRVVRPFQVERRNGWRPLEAPVHVAA